MKAEVVFGNKVTVNDVMDFTMTICGGCGIPFMMPTHRYETLRREHGSFYCPNGCNRVFSGKSKEEILQEQLNSEKNKLANKETQLIQLQSQLTKVSGKLKKTEKRIANGVCPCCSRTFKDLAAHIQTKHPEYKDETKK